MTQRLNKILNKILLISNGGSGKSTLAKKLEKILNMNLLHLDNIYWQKGFKKNPSSKFDRCLKKFMTQKKWIIEGTPMRFVEKSLRQG